MSITSLNGLIVKCVLALWKALAYQPLSAEDYGRIELLVSQLEELLPLEWYLQGKAPTPDDTLLAIHQYCRDKASQKDARQFEKAIIACRLIIECNGSVGARELDNAIKALGKVGDYCDRAITSILNSISRPVLFATA